MAQTVDIVMAFVVAQGNRAIAKGEIVSADRVAAVSGGSIRFVDGHAPVEFTQWIAEARPKRLVLVSSARMPPKLRSNTFLLCARNEADELFSVTTGSTPRSTLTCREVVTFAETCADTEKVKARWLEWNRDRLHWTTSGEWAAFVAAAPEGVDDDIVNQSGSVFAATSISEEARSAWWAYKREHENPVSLLFNLARQRFEGAIPCFDDLEAAQTELARTLEEVAGVAARAKLEGWENVFRAARRALDEGGDDPLVQKHFGDAGLSPRALRLLDGAWKASSVFGGMGSWNDQYEGGSSESQALFKAIPPAVEAAVNSIHTK
jgi:hypothetical protein